MQANALVLAVANADAEATRNRVREMQQLNPQIESVIIVAGTQLLASTRAEDAAPRALRREEKPLFDLSNLIRTARETNRGEEVVRKKTIQIEEKPIGHLVVTLPYLSGGEFAGIMQMKFNIALADTRGDTADSISLPLLMLLAAVLAGALLRLNTERKIDLAKLLALGAFLLIALFYQQQRIERLEQIEMRDNKSVAANYLAAAEQFDQLGYLPLVRDPATVNLWDTDHYQRPRGLIAADGSIVC